MDVAKGVGRCLVLLLILNHMLVGLVSAAPGDKVRELPLKDAVQLGIKNSQDIREAKSEVTKKKVELTQAQYAIKSEEAKDSSLFAKPRNLSKDLQIRLKIPEARKQLLIAEETLKSKTRSVQNDMEKLYWNAVQGMLAEAVSQKKLDAAKKALDGVKTMQKLGLADQAAREQADKALEQAASELKQAQLSYKSTRLALGEKVGLDLESGVTLSYIQDYANLNQAMLEKYTSGAEKTNLGLLQDREERKLAEEKFNTNRMLYSAKFGEARMKVIESMYQMKDMDYDLFMANYDVTLEKIGTDWQGWVWLGIIPLPKILLQGEYDGLRYFDDIRQSLPISMMDQNKAVLKEKESRKNVILAIRQSYLDAKGAEEAYAQSLRVRDKAADGVEEAIKKMKLGLLKTDELQKLIEAKEQAEQAVTSSWISYKLALGKLNFDSGGEVELTYKEGILPYREIDDGLAKIKPPQPEKKGPAGKWELKPSVGELMSDFAIQADKGLEATDFAIFTAEGKPVGKKKPIKKRVRHLSVMFSQPENLKVVLFKKNEVVAEGALAGNGTSGTIAFDKPGELAALPAVKEAAQASAKPNVEVEKGEAPEGTLIIGTYRIPVEALTPELYNTAKATMAASGQGVFLKSELSGGAWVSNENAMDLKAMEDPNGSAVVAPEKIAALKLTVELSESGLIAPLLTAAQMVQEVEALKKDTERLKLAKEEAVAANKGADIARLSIELKDAEAQLALMQALQAGDQQAAFKQIALVHNPEALLKQLEAEAGSGASGGAAGGAGSGASGGAAGGAGNGASGGSAGGAGSGASAAVVEQRKQQLQQALAAGDAAAASSLAAQLSEAAMQLALLESGRAESVAALQEAKAKLQAAVAEAQKQKDMQRAEQLLNSIASLDNAVLSAQKEALFMQLDAIMQLPSQLLDGEQQVNAVLPEAVQGVLAQESKQILEQIKSVELEKYSKEQLVLLSEAAAEMKQAYGDSMQIFPVENVISPDLSILFEVPPAIINGKTFLPIRPVSEAFGAVVIYDEAARTVTISHEGAMIVCTIDSTTGYVDGEAVSLDTAPVLIAGRTFVPLRFIAETIGLGVHWDEGTRTILVSSQ
ncbi:stalk domain-containing protein [Paenibacillus radicis (ex Xue et al. 2023)]|uniref:Stalk domain-containing protein n=1 Tax=Paenibacillus radicis (ex Xue et al. 2023) TaxID=2972489 RepID=A0ABT1YKT7_9BACL|nr:stalk domain-containing protein [Paenibacillus radicis (ex Xue et al. 2023)]MCR8633799.1 stalk domain-containing protein [Paenibacillus radicis (ex Xue et al. 2023)]